MFDDDDGFGFEEAMVAGTGYALLRHGQDRQTAQLINALQRDDDDSIPDPTDPIEVHVHTGEDQPTGHPPINALDFTTVDMPADWESYIGQEPLKRQVMVKMASAQVRKAPFAHTLLASGYPGVGKTTMARLIAKTLDVPIIELVPPFNIWTLVEAAQQLPDRGVLFIDEIHKLADSGGAKGAEILLKVLEDRVAYMPDGTVVPLNQITIIGATTDPDKLPEPVIDRFEFKPYFQAYDLSELGRIAVSFAYRHRSEMFMEDLTALAIAKACRATPRIIEKMVESCRDMALALGSNPTPQELLEFLEVEPDGLTRVHIHYLTAMKQYFGRETRDGSVEFIVGEAAIQQILRETKPGIGRIERFLVERGLIDRTPRGRRLTPLGIARADAFIAAGKGVADVA